MFPYHLVFYNHQLQVNKCKIDKEEILKMDKTTYNSNLITNYF